MAFAFHGGHQRIDDKPTSIRLNPMLFAVLAAASMLLNTSPATALSFQDNGFAALFAELNPGAGGSPDPSASARSSPLRTHPAQRSISLSGSSMSYLTFDESICEYDSLLRCPRWQRLVPVQPPYPIS